MQDWQRGRQGPGVRHQQLRGPTGVGQAEHSDAEVSTWTRVYMLLVAIRSLVTFARTVSVGMEQELKCARSPAEVKGQRARQELDLQAKQPKDSRLWEMGFKESALEPVEGEGEGLGEQATEQTGSAGFTRGNRGNSEQSRTSNFGKNDGGFFTR